MEEDPNLVYVGCRKFDCYRAISPRLFPRRIRGKNFKKIVKEILRNAILVPAEGKSQIIVHPAKASDYNQSG